MSRSETVSFFKSLEKKPRKGLSQNFLIDSHIISKTIDLANILPGSAVLEIGPGLGALTKKLLSKKAFVTAVEIDPLLADALRKIQDDHLKVIEEDFLKFPLPPSSPTFKIVGNLPFHITAPILGKIFEVPFSSLTLILQKEVADRIMAFSGKDFGPLSLFVQFHTEYKSSFTIPPSAFYPSPKVESTAMQLNYKTPPEIDKKFFFDLVKKAFQQRRKMLTSTLPFEKSKIQEALSSIGIRPDARAENLCFEKWISFGKILKSFAV